MMKGSAHSPENGNKEVFILTTPSQYCSLGSVSLIKHDKEIKVMQTRRKKIKMSLFDNLDCQCN